LSILLRISLIFLLAACTDEQSRSLGQQPKKTIDRVSTDVNKAMQQGADRLKEEPK
jgi:hypothetical protein